MTLTHKMAVKKVLIVLAIAGISQAYAAPPVTNYEYDANGNNTKVTDGLSNATTQQYDAVDRLIKQSQPHPTSTGQLGQINQTYNALDALTGVTDPRNLATTYTKDAYGRVLTQTSPDTGTTTYTYDNTGNVLTKTDARGAVVSYTYDALNRVKTIRPKPSSTGTVEEYIAFNYDEGTNGKGRLTSMSDLTGGTTWAYSTTGQIIRKQSRIGNAVFDLQWQYDSAGRVSRCIYPSGRYIDYGYNSNGQVNQLSVDGQVMVSNIKYHPNGMFKSYIWGNNQSYSRAIDSSGRPVTMSLGGSEVLQLTYDNAGRIKQIYRAATATPTTLIAGSSTSYSYDNLDRLTSQVTSSSNTGYQYDLNGNRTNLTVGANSYAYTMDANSNKLTAEAGPTARSYTYDANGSINNNGQDTYSYYSSGRLKQVTRTATSTNIYALRYNGFGQYVHRTNSARLYTYDEQQHLIGEYNGSADVVQETVYLGDTPILTLRPDSLIRTADNTSTATTATATLTGTWTSATTIKGYYGSSYHTHAAAASTTDKVTYTITPTATQSFKVYARWAAQSTNATNAIYTIAPNTSGSTPTTITVDQTRNGGTWNYLGTYSLNTANPMTVTLSGQGNGIVVADAIRIVPATASSVQSNSYFVHTDHLNTPRLITSYTNQKRWTWYAESSEAFGANVPNENPATLGVFSYNLRFPGQLYDPTSQLSYNYYRDYNPRTGRYIESDPIGLDAGQMSTYTYVDGNPLNFIDPKGTDKTVLFNTTGGRSIFNLPTNGNWGGRCWSGGANSCGHPMGTLPPTDSADACYMEHDYCYDSCDKNTDVCQDKNSCRKSCDLKLYACLKGLPDDPRTWPSPPRPGTEKDTLGYRRDAIYHYRPRNIFTE